MTTKEPNFSFGHLIPNDNRFDGIYNNFIVTLDIIKSFNYILPALLQDAMEQTKIKNRNILDNLGDEAKKELERFIKTDITKEVYKTTNEEVGKILGEYAVNLIYGSRYDMFIREMSLVYLIAEFEVFLQRNITIFLEKDNRHVYSSDRKLSYEAVFRFKTLDEVKSYAINEIILDLFRDDINEVAEYYEKKIGMNIKNFVEWDILYERFCRRNILIHNSGIVNKLYIEKTGYNGNIGTKLEISVEYLNDSIEIFKKISNEIHENLSKKYL